MFCMHCGQQLPDGAKFCYNCGNKTFSKEDLPAEPITEIDKETLPQPTEEPVYIPEEKPIVFPTEEPVFSPAEEPIYQTEEPVDFAQTQKGKHKNSSGGTKRKIFLILGIAAALIVALVIALVTVNSSKHEPEIPDPEYYFALPLSDTSQNDGMITYTINANHVEDDLSAAVYAYIDTLRNDYDFMINTIEEDSGYINANLMSFGDSYGEMQVIYQHDYATNKIEVKTTTNIRLVSGVSYYDDADTIPLDESDEETEAVQSDAVNRDPAVLPDVAKVDSTGTFSYFTSFFHTEYKDLLYTSYISNDPNAVYEANAYVELLCDMGYIVDRIDEDNTYFLYHPDVDAPTIPGEKAQISVIGHVNFDSTGAFISITMPREICIEGYENKYQEMLDWHAKNDAEKESSSSSSSSSGSSSSSSSSSGSSSSYNKDLYDNDPICGVCNGDGDCSKCGGSGYLHSSASDEEDRNCYKCNGSGQCGSCGGDGRL